MSPLTLLPNAGLSPLTRGHLPAHTFEDDLKLIPKDVKDAVSGVGLRDHMVPQPASARVLVEIVTGLL